MFWNDFFKLQKKIPWNRLRSRAIKDSTKKANIKNVNNVLNKFFLKIINKIKKKHYLEVPEPKRFYKRKDRER